MFNGLRSGRLIIAIVVLILTLVITIPLAAAVLDAPAGTGEIAGVVYFDKNGNAGRDANDSGISAAQVQVLDTATGGQAFSASQLTAADGTYSFAGLAAGAYTVIAAPGQAYTSTTAASANLDVNNHAVTQDFGQTLLLYVTGIEFQDLNGDGSHAPREPGVGDVQVTVWGDANGNGYPDADEPILGTAVTNAYGHYVIGNLLPGARVVVTRSLGPGGVDGPPHPLTLEGSEMSGASVLLLNGVREQGAAVASDVVSEAPFVEDEVVVGFQPGVSAEQAAAIIARHGASVKETISRGNAYLLAAAPGAAPRPALALMAELSREPAVRYVEPNDIVQGSLTPDDPDYLDTPYTVWAPQWINAEPAWDVTLGDSNLIVAVLDTGISYPHSEFSGRILQGWDYVNLDNSGNGNYAQDDNGHGTHVSGIIGAAINNSLGMVGLAPNIKILPVKVLNASMSGNWTNVANGIYYAVDNGARIINLSLGSTASSTLVLDALRYAAAHNVLAVCAAGNNGSLINFYPAAYDECVGVSGSMEGDAWYTLSNYGAWVDLAAPASSIYSTYWTSSNANTFYWKDGTSMAAPHVAGLAALLLSVKPNLGTADLRAIMQQSAVDVAPSGWDNHFGWGRINVGAAVALAQGWTAYTPTPTATNTPQPPTPTNTPAPPTATHTPVPPTPTNTPLPATATNTPRPATATNTPLPPTATHTPVPPTPTQTPTNTPTPYLQRVNAGNTSTTALYTDTSGQVWAADKPYVAGSWGYVSGSTKSYSTAVTGTDDDKLYQKLREGMSSYKFTVPPGQYAVTLRWAEFAASATSLRIMKITINGVDVETALNVFAVTGGKAIALDRTYSATVGADGLLTIAFAQVGGRYKPMVSAILVQSSGPPPTPTPTPTPAPTATPCTTCPTSTPTSTRTPTPTATGTNTPVPFVRRVNPGGTTFTDTLAQVWTADQAYATGGWGYVGGSKSSSNSAVAGTNDDLLFQKYRGAMTSYKFTVSNGVYQVRLRFAEFSTTTAGARAMKITIEGVVVVNGLDVYATVGSAAALDRTYQVTVSDGILQIDFARATGATLDPIVSAVEVKN